MNDGTVRSGGLLAVASIFGALLLPAGEAQPQASGSVVQDRVRVAIRRVLGGAHTSARVMARLIGDAAENVRKQVPEASTLFPAELETFAKSSDDRTALLLRAYALRCGEISIQNDEDNTTFVGRATRCLSDALVSTQAAAAIHAIRGTIRNLGNVAVLGSARLKPALPYVAKYMPVGVAHADLISDELRASLETASDATARAFGQRATACAALGTKTGESASDFARRTGDCLSKVSAETKKKAIDPLIVKAVDRLIQIAQTGTRSLRTGIERAVGLLDGAVNAAVLFPESLRSALADASPLVGTSFVRGARRCRRMVRGPNQLPDSFVKQMGLCLAGSVEEASPFALVPIVLGAVKAVIAGAEGGAAALKKALKVGDEQLHGRVPAAHIFGGDVRRHIALAKPGWVAQFAKLGAICQKREFKKHHRFDEFMIRVNLCLSSAASGLTPERLQQRILQSMGIVAKSGRAGARSLRIVLKSEVGALDKIMRVMDLYPDPWRVSMSELADTSARAFSRIAAKCPQLKRGEEEGLGQYVKRLAACLETARMQSGGDALARKVREAVMSLVYAAQTSSGTLRNALGPAVSIVRGFVSPNQLFSASLRGALNVASDELAATFAQDARKCVGIERLGNVALARYVQNVANCLAASTRGSLDKARQEKVHEALEKLAALADGGPATISAGYPALWVSLRNLLGLGGTLPRGLGFVERTNEFAKRLRAECLHLPAGSASELGQVRGCVMTAHAAANAIAPPDACRGKVSSNLAECCLLGSNRMLPSCAALRYACRTGETFRNGACVSSATVVGSAQCPLGQQASGGVCIGVPCPPGTARNAQGICAVGSTCPAGATLDTLGRCVQTSCPVGAVPNHFNQCVSGACPVRTVAGPYGGCVVATCAYGATMDHYGRCQTIVCPDGQTFNAHRQCAPIAGYTTPGYTTPGYTTPGYATPGYATPGYATPGYTTPGYATPGYATPGYATPGYTAPAPSCGYGTVVGAGGLCVRSFCPPGTIANALGQCVQGGCPYGYVMSTVGTCVR